jgi:hypothetical protein
MQKIYFFILLSFVIVQAKAQSLTPDVLYYNFNGTGSSVANLASNPTVGTATATINGGLIIGGDGKCGTSLIGSGLSSTTDFLKTNWVTNLGNKSWTIAFWNKGFVADTIEYYAFGDSSANNFRCFTNGAAGNYNWILKGDSIADVILPYGADETSFNHCVFTYDSATQQIKGYVNGYLETTVSQTALNITGTDFFKIMGYKNNIGASAGALIDEFRLYSRALSTSEIEMLYDASYSKYSTITENICNGASYTFNGQNLTTTGVYYDTIVNTLGCDSIVTLNLVVGINVSATVSGVCLGNTAELKATTAALGFQAPFDNASGTFYNTGTFTTGGYDFTNAPNSITVTSSNDLSGNDGSRIWTTGVIKEAGTITFNWSYSTPQGPTDDAMVYRKNTESKKVFTGFTYSGGSTQSGIQTISVNPGDQISFEVFTFDNSGGACTYTLSNFAFTPSIPATYQWSGNSLINANSANASTVLTTLGQQTYTVTASYTNGCSSTTTLSFDVKAPSTNTISVTACDNYFFNSQNIMSSGAYYDTLVNAVGCDSIITLNLVINSSSSYSYADTICNGATYIFNNQNTNSTGTYYDTLINAIGCDSFITLDLYVRPSLDAIITTASKDTLCQGSVVSLSAININDALVYDFLGPFNYNIGTYYTTGSFTTGGFNFANSPNSVIMVSSNNSSNTTGSSFWQSGAITEDGTLQFNWSYTSVDGPAGDYVRYKINNGPFQLLNGYAFFATSNQSGSQTLVLNAGDVVTFEIYTKDNIFGACTVVFDNCSFTPTPEYTYLWTGTELGNTIYNKADASLTMPGIQTYTVVCTNAIGCSRTETKSVFSQPYFSQLANTGSSNTQTQTDGTQLTYTDNACAVIAGVEDASLGNALGNTTASVTIDAAVLLNNGQPYCRRHYDITPTSQGAAIVTLYATLADFLDYNITAADSGLLLLPIDTNDTNVLKPNVRVTQVHGTGGFGTGATEVIIPTSVTWNNTLNAWEIKLAVDSFSSFFIHTGAAAPLSINLQTFYGVVKGEADVINWTTASEKNSNYFEVMHSTDEINYTKLATVDSKAINCNSSTPLHYEYINANAKDGNNFYQLKMVDKTGTISLSNTIKLYHQPKSNVVYVSPNPFTNSLNITIDALQNDDVAITVMDATGKLIQYGNKIIEQGINKISLNASNWASGIYFVHVKDSDNAVVVTRVVKL